MSERGATQHLLFPAMVMEHAVSMDPGEKDGRLTACVKHLNEEGRSEELTGATQIHRDEDFRWLLEHIGSAVREHLRALNVAPEEWDINLTKCWLNIIGDEENPRHGHADAHLAFVSYLNVPENLAKPIRFYSADRANDLWAGMARWSSTGWTYLNSQSWWLPAKEGTTYTFPAKLEHDTWNGDRPKTGLAARCHSAEDLKLRRVSVAGDILFTLKNPAPRSLGVQPINIWIKL